MRPVEPDKENIMRAVVITKHGDPSVLQVATDPPPPGPASCGSPSAQQVNC